MVSVLSSGSCAVRRTGVLLTAAIGVLVALPAGAEELIVTNDETVILSTESETVEDATVIVVVDSHETIGAGIGNEPNSSGSLIVRSGVTWNNVSCFINWFSPTPFADTLGLAVGSNAGNVVDSEGTLGSLLLESGSTLNHTGSVVVGWDSWNHIKRGEITLEAGAVWNINTDDPDMPNASDFQVRHGEVSVFGELTSRSGIQIGNTGSPNADAAMHVHGVGALLDARDNDLGLWINVATNSTNGSALLQVTGGASVMADSLSVGSGGMDVNGTLVVGQLGDGTVSMVDVDSFNIEAGIGGQSTVVVNDMGRIFSNGGMDINSQGGDGQLIVNEGGAVSLWSWANMNSPKGGMWVSEGTTVTVDGGVIAIGGGLGTLELLQQDAIHLGLGGGLRANGEIYSDILVHSHGLLWGAGEIHGDVMVSPGGSINPGNSAGALTIFGDLTIEDGGVITIEVGGTDTGQYDQIAVMGDMTLGGELEIAFIDGFVPEDGQTFDLTIFLPQGSVGGSFSGFSTAGLGEGLSLNINEDLLSQGILSVGVVPEPASLVLLGAGALLLARRRRR